MSYTIRNLREVEDLAAKHGFGEVQEARFPRGDLEAERTGLMYLILKPGKRSAFGHRHKEAEEIYVVLSGHGRIKLDDDIVAIRPLDSIRMAPGVTRALEAGPEGLEVLAFGPRHEDDAEIVADFWVEEGGNSRIEGKEGPAPGASSDAREVDRLSPAQLRARRVSDVRAGRYAAAATGCAGGLSPASGNSGGAIRR